jgi:pimeloyl-ACP methyl ester carboxylesterase
MRPLSVIHVAGTRLHYLEEGSGEPLLLLHGVNSGARYWESTLAALSPHFRVVAIDLPGWGHTPPPPGFGYDIESALAFIRQVIDALDMPRPAVVGHSFGGCLALHMAARMPERVARLVVVAPAGLQTGVHWSYRALGVPGLGEWLMRPSRANVEASLSFVTQRDRVPAAFADYCLAVGQQRFFRQTSLRWVRRNHAFWLGARRICVTDRLHAIRCPTLVVWGDADPLIPPDNARVAASIPGARLVLLPGVKHCPNFEVPDQFHALLTEFLGESPAAGRSVWHDATYAAGVLRQDATDRGRSRLAGGAPAG